MPWLTPQKIKKVSKVNFGCLRCIKCDRWHPICYCSRYCGSPTCKK